MQVQKKKANLHYGQGTAKLLQKDYTSALNHLLEALILSPKDSKLHNNLGMAYYFKKDMRNALKHLKTSLRLNPQNSKARNNLAAIYAQSGELGKAKKHYNLVLKDLLYKHQYRTHYNLALIDLRENRPDEAYKKFEISVKKNKDYCPAYYQMGLSSQRQKSHLEAIKLFRKATRGSCINNPAPLYHMALSHMDLNQHEKAFHELNGIIERFPGNPYAKLSARKLQAIKIYQFRNKGGKKVRPSSTSPPSHL